MGSAPVQSQRRTRPPRRGAGRRVLPRPGLRRPGAELALSPRRDRPDLCQRAHAGHLRGQDAPSDTHGHPLEAVTPVKQRRLRRLAAVYVHQPDGLLGGDPLRRRHRCSDATSTSSKVRSETLPPRVDTHGDPHCRAQGRGRHRDDEPSRAQERRQRRDAERAQGSLRRGGGPPRRPGDGADRGGWRLLLGRRPLGPQRPGHRPLALGPGPHAATGRRGARRCTTSPSRPSPRWTASPWARACPWLSVATSSSAATGRGSP